MKKTFKKFLSMLLVCSMIFTTHSFATFADAINNEETEIETTTETETETEKETETEEIETTTLEETEDSNVGASSTKSHNRERARDEEETSTDEVSEPDLESTEYVEEPEFDETTIEEEIETIETETSETEIEENNVETDYVSEEEESTTNEISIEDESDSPIDNETGSQAHPYDIDEETTTEAETTEAETTEAETTAIVEIETDAEKKVENPILAIENMKFSFAFGSDHTFGSFDKAGNQFSVEYNSSELPGKPVVIPPIYYKKLKSSGYPLFRFTWKTNSGDVYDDSEMETIIQNWMQNPDMDRNYYVSAYEVNAIDIETNPTKLTYDVGDIVDPSGLVLRLRNTSIGRSELASYDLPEYKDIITYELIDTSHRKMSSTTITADTFSIRFRFNNSIAYKDVEIQVNPCTFTFSVSDNLGLFNAADGPSTIQFKSDELATKPVEIPVVYLKEITSGANNVNVGWKNYFDGNKKVTDAQLANFVSEWSKKPTTNMRFDVNFEEIKKSRVKTSPKVDYFVGDTFDPSGLVIEVSDSNRTWAKDIPYDKPEFQRLYTYKLYDKKDQEISGTTITGQTKYCRFQYNSNLHENVNINIKKRITEISIVKEQNWKEYSSGEKFDPEGLVIKVKYDDESEEEVSYDSKRTLFTFDPMTITSGTSQINVNYGGKTTTTSVTVVDNAYVLYYYDYNIDSINTFYARTGEESIVESALDNAISLGAKGFYKMNAKGCYDGRKSYFKDFKYSLSRDEALEVYNNEYDGNSSIYLAASFFIPPSPDDGGDGGDGGGGSGGGSGGHAGGHIGLNNNNGIPSINNIPQSKLVVNMQLTNSLLSYSINANRSASKVVDRNGNEGFGRWLQVPGTTEWYFLSGEASADGSKGTYGFISSGFYNLNWNGRDAWFYFDENGAMKVGWYEENGKIYFLQNDFSDGMYGRVLTGTHTIDGKTYNFGNDGALTN